MKKRSTALTVLLIVVIAGTLLGMVRSANAAAGSVEQQFYNGVEMDGGKYVEPSIQQQLDKRAEAALGLVTVTKKYPFASDMTGALREARQVLLEAKTIGDKYRANIKLEAAWTAAYEAVRAHAGDVPASLESYAATLRGAQGAIDNSHYNETAGRLDSELRAFPIGLLRALGVLDLPESFGEKT